LSVKGIMTLDFLEAECPSCGANLKLSPDLKKGSCEHCGGVCIIIDDKDDDQDDKKSIPCPMCHGKGLTRCLGARTDSVESNFRTYNLFVEACMGDGLCHITSHPEKPGISSNYCVRGKCAWCKGTGKTLLGECKFCGGSGDCRFCRGSGKCTLCKGEGLIRCMSCKGRGYNQYRWRY
jgi:hypothetical protein